MTSDRGASPMPVAATRAAGARAADRAERLLGSDGRLVVHGPWGSGKSVVLSELARRAVGDGVPVLRVAAAPGDRDLAHAALATLFVVRPPGMAEAVVEDKRGALAAAIGGVGPGGAAGHPLAVRLALTDLFASLARDGSALLLIDDAQWLDVAGAEALGHSLRAAASERLRVVVAERGCRETPLAGRLCGDHAVRLPLEPLTVDDVADVLNSHALPTGWASRVHQYTGGNPALVRAMAIGQLRQRPDPRGRVAPSVPDTARAAAEIWLGTVGPGPRATLLTAALAHRPTPALLRRAGCADAAERQLAEARNAGIVRIEPTGVVEFAAPALRDAAAHTMTRSDSAAAHRALAAAADDPVRAVRHRLLTSDAFDRTLAESGESAARQAGSRGERTLAAELLLLSADRTPAGHRADRMRRLATAASHAAASGSFDLAVRVADAVRAAGAGRVEQVAALLAVIDAGGQAMGELDDIIARARERAGEDPALLAAVQLRVAVRTNLCDGLPGSARAAADRAVRMARNGGDLALEAAALSMRARMERITGHPGSTRTLATALALAVPAERVGIRNSPQYLAARHAVFDDRLGAAREALLRLLPLAERTGDAEDLQEVLRSLAEVDARSGACVQALEWGERALSQCAGAGLSPGPASYTAALVQSAGGSFAEAAAHAARGVRVSREERDLVFTSRNLFALGTVRLITGRLTQAAEALREVAALEAEQQVRDATALRWQPELIETLVGLGRLDEARALLARVRRAMGSAALSTGPGAALARAEATYRDRTGEPDTGRALLDTSLVQFRALGLQVEEGRTLLHLARLERGRRRQAAAREAAQRAHALFARIHARPWVALLNAPAASAAGPLTEAEAALATIVAEGATNQEAANRLHLSVKTVEAVLSRVYRKLGVRSRTELGPALRRLDPSR
ncbi:LuxR family transcriptional regulator [Streptomyces sp. NPDC002506]|uniref:helix-turn-helix transcriptional regulator n=1 Tax=Streptomyces sp. NPDC002506 TaxID=3154536 RepID=UPI0033179676